MIEYRVLLNLNNGRTHLERLSGVLAKGDSGIVCVDEGLHPNPLWTLFADDSGRPGLADHGRILEEDTWFGPVTWGGRCRYCYEWAFKNYEATLSTA